MARALAKSARRARGPGYLALLAAVVLGGCVMDVARSPERPAPAATVDAPAPAPPVEAQPVTPAGPGPALVLSGDLAHYQAVADALQARLENDTAGRYVIRGDNGPALLEALRAAGHAEAIAIGRRALKLLAGTGLRTAFCQVFAPGALAAGHPGVAALPSYAAQLDSWLGLDPGLATVGIIMGPGHADGAAALVAAGETRGVRVRHAVARSDRELLYVFRRMVPELDGFLLYPDARILSPPALRELLAYAAKHDVAVVTYNRAIYELGADVLMVADPDEVARQALAALSAGADGATFPLHGVVTEFRGDSALVSR